MKGKFLNTFKKELATKASILYYEENNNQDEIASKIGISRSYVSQLLSYARSHNIVRIVVNVEGFYSHLVKKEIEFSKYFPEVKQFYFMKSKSPEYTKKYIGKFAAPLVSELIKKSNIIAIDPGTSVQKIIKELRPNLFKNYRNKLILPSMGGIDNENVKVCPNDLVRKLGQIINCEYLFLNSPAVVANYRLRDALLKEKNIQEVVSHWDKIELDIFGIGDVKEGSILFSLLNRDMIQEIKNSKAVGETQINFFDKEGNCLPLLEKYRIGLPLEKLRKINMKVSIAFGKEKALAITSILKAKLIDVLISDSITVHAMEKYLKDFRK